MSSVPALSDALDEESNRVKLRVQCYGAPVDERTHEYEGYDLKQAVTNANIALSGWINKK